ncbi:phosphohistidine phosphatase [Nonlabens sp. Hel1_33_55]|uniref:SixA phosphatase family protein n=1 Tax=Nonlabens sp. Hel1_33_55 TaxID=1336802 RepID=UPI000875D360|nr:histidine phosphatase family protein [Nonlabens sp. Hel1_33_55]SCX95992.1 phosphohistidine phosphatase [Nonlabens sp. Hel1_33_55]
MKKLIITRHGKSSWEFDVRDHDRPLIQKGIDDAHTIGNALKELNTSPDLILSSTAARALQTATIITEYIDYQLKKLKLTRDLYTFNWNEQLKVLKDLDNDIDTCMIVSHNHGLTDLAGIIGSERFSNIPTTGVVIIEFPVDDWSQINKGNTTFHLFPKNIQ